MGLTDLLGRFFGDAVRLAAQHPLAVFVLVAGLAASIAAGAKRWHTGRVVGFSLLALILACALDGAFIGALLGFIDSWLWMPFVVVGTVVLVIVAWILLPRIARRHEDAEPRGKAKVGIAIAFSLALGLGGLLVLGAFPGVSGFEQHAREGMHDTLLKNLNRTVGEGDYLEAARAVVNKPVTLAGLQTKLAGFNETFAAMAPTDAGYAAMAKNITETWMAVNQTRIDIHDAGVKMRSLSPNHALWVKVEPLIRAHRDDEAEAIVLKTVDPAHITDADALGPLGAVTSPCARDAEGYCKQPLQPQIILHSYIDLHGHSVPFDEDGPGVFRAQREFNEQMDTQMRWFVYPGVTGLFLAPFAFVGGHILGKAFDESSGVGYKRYPGKAAGFFLLFTGLFGVVVAAVTTGRLAQATGGVIPKFWNLAPMIDLFGILAIPFAAWVLRDLSKRSLEGQIAL